MYSSYTWHISTIIILKTEITSPYTNCLFSKILKNFYIDNSFEPLSQAQEKASDSKHLEGRMGGLSTNSGCRLHSCSAIM